MDSNHAPASATPVGSRGRYNLLLLWLICLVAAMGGLLFGYDLVVIGGAKQFYEPHFGITGQAMLQGWAVSSALVGCLVGAVVSGLFADRFGRKKLLILAGLLFTVSAIGTAWTGVFAWFNVFRLIGGMGMGLASNLSPMFIAELSPAEIRGRFVSINQLTIVIGIVAAQFANWAIAEPVPTAQQLRIAASNESALRAAYGDNADARLKQAKAITSEQGLERVRQRFPNVGVGSEPATKDSALINAYLPATWNGQTGWRWMFGAEALPAAVFMLLMLGVPESPRWLVKYDRAEQARRILARIGGEPYARHEIDDIRATLSEEERSRVRYRDLLERRLLPVLALGAFLAVFQQWCGINVIFNYAPEVFHSAGYGISAVMMNIVITGAVMLTFTVIAMLGVDTWGRRKLMLIGSAGLALIYAALGLGYYTQTQGIGMLLLVVAAIACYAVSLAPIVWVIISEIFPNRIRGAAVAVAVFALWAGSATLSFTFPILNSGSELLNWGGLGTSGTFWLYGVICAVGFVVVHRYLPETKGKSLEQIERELVD